MSGTLRLRPHEVNGRMWRGARHFSGSTLARMIAVFAAIYPKPMSLSLSVSSRTPNLLAASLVCLVIVFKLMSSAHAQPATTAGTPPAATAGAATAATAAPASGQGVATTAQPSAATGSQGAVSAKPLDVIENPYGLEALWRGGDWVAKGTLMILLVMSMGSWYIIVTKLLEQIRIGSHARDAGQSFWAAGTVRQGADGLRAGSPFRYIAEQGIEATKKHDGLLGHVDLNTWITMSIQRAMDHVQSRLQDGLAFLATVGSTAPFVGLFGTVWGIYNALTAIGVAGQASIDKVAGPVGEALIMTAIGLAVAVPAVLGYNWMVRRNRTTMEKVREFGSDLHAVLLGSSAASAAAGAAGVAAAGSSAGAQGTAPAGTP